MSKTIGLDVGGAHLKVAVLKNGQLSGARQILCPLWQGLDKLDAALAEANSLTANADQVAITMTGELSDLFDTREAGVHTLVDRLAIEFGDKALFWIGKQGFGMTDKAKKHHCDVGSTNFLATATAAARDAPDALLIDIGSTTTDIVPIFCGKPVPIGLNDSRRLQTGELVYTGLTRTPVMAVTNHVPVGGIWQTMARENLATMADIYRLLGQLPEGVDLHDTSDGRGKSLEESLARFARMLGCESDELTNADIKVWKPTASYIADKQLRSIEEGVHQVLSANPELETPTIVTAGIGALIAAKVAMRLGLEHTTFGKLVGAPSEIRDAVTFNAPAAAVALLGKN